MTNSKNNSANYTVCPECHGRGKKRRKLRKKVRLQYQFALDVVKKINSKETTPIPPRGHLYFCLKCSGSGLVSASHPPQADTENYPHVAIIGGGIGDVALAVACIHLGIPFKLYERDSSFDERNQGYGLTLQQASKVVAG